MFKIVTAGLHERGERLFLAGTVLLIAFYAVAAGWLELRSVRFDQTFLARREAMRIDRLPPVPCHVPLAAASGGHTAEQLFFREGWGKPESWGIWTQSARADLLLKLPPECRTRSAIEIVAVIMLGTDGTQRVTITSGTATLGVWDIRTPGLALHMALPEASVTASGVLDLVITIGSPRRPGNGDGRLLGLGLRTVAIMPQSAAGLGAGTPDPG